MMVIVFLRYTLNSYIIRWSKHPRKINTDIYAPINGTLLKENRERYCLHVEKKPATNSLSKNKPRLLPNSQPEVYQLVCSCNGKYIGKSKRECLQDAQNINRIAWVENGNHLDLQNNKKNAMNNLTGCIRKQYALHHAYTKEKSAERLK